MGMPCSAAYRQQPLAGREVPDAPRSDHPDSRRQRVGPEFETHLVVALAGGAVCDGVCTGVRGDLHEPFGDEWPGDRSAQQVFALVDGVGTEHGEHEVAGELLAQVSMRISVTPRAAALARPVQFLTLAQVRP